MTVTTHDTASAAVASPAQAPQAPTKPPINVVIKAIATESRAKGVPCNRRRAKAVYNILALAVKQCRLYTGGVYHLDDDDLDRCHAVLEVVMPDDTVARDGSAHDLINRRLLRGDELGIVHTADYVAGVRNCTVCVSVHSLS